MNLKKVRSAIRNFILAAGLGVPLFWTVSCEIGLGESVDTQAPVISITYPPVGATIMEDFILSGTYADDKGITGVTVTIQGTGIDNGNFSMGPLAATYADNIWQINLNKSNGTGIYNGYDIPDGPIEVTVNVSDGGNHTTTEKRALEIDNTAPILILAKPLSTAQDASPTTYGRVLKLTGDIYDLHQSNGISVKLHYALYDREAGTIGAVKTLDGYSINSSMTDDSPLIIAQYYPTNEANDDAKKAMRQNYITLYGTDADAGNGHTLDKIFYCGVQLTDCAKVYRNPADQTGADKGNTTERYYINSTNFYNELQSESSTRTGGKNFNISATKIAKMFNGTGTEYSADDKAVIIDVLNTKGNWSTSVAENINTEESSKFLINPDNSPTWNVSGYELGNALGDAVTGFRALAQGSSVSFNINAGRDNTLIRPETVSVKLRHYTSFESYKSGVSSGDDIILLEKGTLSENDAATAISQQFTPTGKDVTLRAGEFYVFVVEGIDRNTNEVVSANGAVYGFMVKRAETPPELYDVSTREIINDVESAETIDEAAGGFTNGKNEIKISGKVKMLGQEFAEDTPVAVSYTCSNLLDSSQVIGDLDTEITVNCGTIVDDMAGWSVVLGGKLCPDAPSKYKITVNIVIKNASDITSATERINFYVDNMEPEVKNEKVSPYVVVGESNVLNGKVKYSASITDNNEVADENIGTWYARNGNAEIASGPIDKTDFTTTAINTTRIGETGTLTIEADACDKVGNLKKHIKTYAVDQKTDKPVITPGNYKTDVAAGDIKVNSNLFGITSNNKIYATITDDDGIARVRVYRRLLPNGEKNLIMEESGDGMLTYALTIDLNSFKVEGKYEFRVEVDDILDETDYSKIKDEDHVFYAGVSSGAPSIQRTTQDDLYVSTSSPCIVKGNVDVKAIKVLRHTTVNASDDGVPVTTYTAGDSSWEDSYLAPEAKGGKVYYFAYDVFGQTTAATFTYRIDEEAPTVAPDWTGPADAKKWTNASSVAFKIPLSDAWDNSGAGSVINELSSSGIESAAYWIDTYAGDPSGPLAGRNQYNKDKFGNQYLNYDATIDLDDGKHKIYVKAVDSAGNKLEIKDDRAYEYWIDTTPPVIDSVEKSIIDDKTLNISDVDNLSKTPVTITVAANDGTGDVSGIDKYKLVENNRELDLVASDGVFSLTSEILTHGVHNFTVRAYDNAGNYSDSDPVEIRVDSTLPTASVTSVSPTVTVKEGAVNKTYVNGVISISGSASDETALGTDGTVEVFVDDDSIGDATLTGQSWTIENYNTKDLTDNTEHKIKVVVTDKAGNKGTSAEYTINVKQSTDTPVVDPSNYKTNISADELETNKNLFGKTSNNKLIANITDDDGIDEVVVSYKKNSDSDSSWTAKPAIKVSADGSIEKSYTLNYDLSAHEEGKWNFKIEVTDVLKETNSEYMNTPVVFNIGVSDGAPAISLTTADNTWQQPSTPFTVSGTVATKATRIECRTLDADGKIKESTPLNYTAGSTSWSHSITSTEGATVHFVAIDEFKQENSIPFTYKIDSHNPTIASDWTNTDANHGETVVWRNSGSLKLEIPVSDSWNGNFDTGEKWGENSISGISRVYYTVDDGSEEGTTEGNLYGVGNKANYRYYKTTLALSDGSHVVKVFVVDDAARSINRSFTYNIDTNAPKITDSKFIVNGSVLHAATVSRSDLDNMGTKKIKITANVTDLVVAGIDHVSGIDTVELYDGNTKVNNINLSVSSGVYTFEFPNEGATRTILTDGTHSFTVRATDKVGNVSTSDAITVTVDGTLPSAAVSGVSPTVTKDNKTYINGIVKFTGTVSDNSALGKFIYFYVDEKEYGDPISVESGLTYKAWGMSVDTRELTDDVEHKFTVKVADTAGNTTTSAEYKVIVDQDTDIPAIAFANLSAGDNVFGSDGKDKITFTVTEDDLIKSIKVYVDGSTTASYKYEPAAPELSTKTVSLNVTAATNDDSKGDIKLSEEGIHKINIVVEDNLFRSGDNAKKTGDTEFILDNSVPVLSETKIGESGLITNGGADKKIVISLKADDGYGLSKVEITDSMNASSKWELTPESGELKSMERDQEISFGSGIGNLADGNHVITIKATDLAGKTTQIKRNVTVDTVNPKFEKVSEGDSSAAPKITTASTVIDSKSWYKSQQVSLKVMTSDDSGSGVSNVEWTTDDAASESAVWSSLTKDSGTEGLWAGTVTPLVQGANRITVRITDRAGNSTSAELYPYVDTEVPAETVLVKVDDVAGADVDRKIVNGKANVVILLTAKDTGSVDEFKATGIASVSVSRIGGTDLADVNGTPTANADEFKIVIPKEKLATGMVIVKATDKVGNFLETSLFQMELDNTPPKVKISNPASAKTGTDITDIYVNRKISFSGTSSDKNLDDSSRPVLEYSRWNGSAWGDWKSLDVTFTSDTTAGTWTTLPVITETAFVTDGKVPDGSKVKVRATIEDKARNLSNVAEKENETDPKPQCETKEFIVDQNTDRPVIRVTSPNTFQSKNAEGTLVDMSSSVYAWQKNLTYISGIVTDDDGSLTKKDADKGRLYYSTQANPSPTTAGDWTELDAASGSWQINFVKENGNPDDGKFTVHFMVKDNEGAVYTSTTSVDRDKSIILTDGKNEYGAVDSEPPKDNTTFFIGIDNSAPLVSNVEYTRFSEKRKADSAANTLFGGDTTKFKLKLTATDTNGIKKVTISHANFGDSDPIVLKKDAVDAKGNGTYKTSAYIDISKWTSGTYTFKVTAVDMADLEKVENISINIDNDAPEVTMTSPTLDERSKPTDPGAPVVDTVWGANVKATGAVNGTRKLYYAISTTDKVRPYMPVETLEELTASANFDTKLEGNFTDEQKTELTKWTGRDIGEDGSSTPKTDGTVSAEKKQRPSYVTKDKDDKLVYREFNEFKTSAPSSWKLAFDGDDDPSNITTTHTKKVNDWLVDLGVTTKPLIEDNTFTTYVNLYLWIWAEDDAGNVTERSYPIEIDPQGSRPKIDEITNPEVAGTKVTGKVRVSGSATDDVKVKGVWLQFISAQHNLKKNVQSGTDWDNTGRIYGTASPSAFNFTKDDLDYMAAAGMKVFKIKDYKYDKEVDDPDQADQWTVGDSLKTGETASDYAAFVKPASSSWNLKINTNSEFAPANKEETDPSTGETITTPTTNNVAFCVFAHDGEFLSLPRVSSMVFDTESPEITGLTLVQYGEDGTTVSAQRAYKEDMFINSSWWLEGYVKDDTVSDLDVLGTELMVDGVIKTSADFKVNEIHPESVVADKSVSITAANKEEYGDGVEIGKIYELVNGEIYHTYKFALKLDTSTIAKCGLFKGKVEATDNAGHNATPAKITINVDKNAPAIVTMYEYDQDRAAVIENAGDKKVFKKHKYGEKYNVSPLVQNSDGYYTFGSQVMEESVEVTSNGIKTLYNQSGFARVAFYFMRRNSGGAENNQWLYDIMENNSRVNVKDLGTSGLVFKDGLYWVEKRVTPQADRNIVTGDFDDVRKGSLVKINGAYYTTTDESTSTQLVLSEELPGDGTAEITALVAKAQVVDHLVMESAVDGTVRNDDGDGMVESVKKTGTTWTWDASVNTKTIEDGPIELHYVVFDDAGNYSVGIVGNSDSYEAPDGTNDARVFYRKDAINICNRAPRLSKVFLGTDLNGDNSYTQSEFVEYDIFERNGRFTTAVDLETRSYTGKSFRIKDKFAVMPEFVGGNNIMKDAPIKVVFSNDATKDEANYVTSASPVGPVDDPLTTKVYEDKSGNDVMKLVLSDEVKTTWDDRNNWAADGSKNSGAAKYDNESSDLHGLDYYMYLYEFQSADGKLGDESSDEEVNGGIGKRQMSFTFWDNTTDTVQGTSSNYCYLKIKDLIVDVVDTTPPLVKINPFHWNSKSDCSVPLDEETSMPLGHIDLETAEQPNPKVSGQVIIRGTAYDNTRHGGIYISDPSASDSKQLQVAKFENGEWSEVKDNWPEYWKKFEIVEDYGITQDGHTVEWEMVMDMTTFGVDTGKILTAKAVDAKGNDCGYAGNTVAQTKKDALTAKYVMDFVPYIKGVKDANRSRLGRYPVRAGQEIVVEGMNFAKGAGYQVVFYDSANGTKATGRTARSYEDMRNATADSGTWEGTIPADGEITIKAPKYSAYFEVKVTKTGTNGSEASDYVETSNNNNQNIKWNIEEGTLDSKGKPQITPGKNQWNDDRYLSVWNVGTTFAQSPNPIKGTIERMTRSTTKFQASERKGNGHNGSWYNDGDLYAIWGGENNMIYDGVLSLKERWKSICDKDSGALKTPAAEIDTCLINGRVFHTVLDDGWADAETFGKGLLLVRDGETFTADSGANKLTIEQTKVDKVRDQFQNPKVAGYYVGSTADDVNGRYHMFVSYYDKHTHCLKYGKVEFSNKWPENLTEVVDSKNIANDSTGNYVVDGADETTSTADVGSFSDIKIINEKPVIVYYDKGNKKLKVAVADSNTPTSWSISSFNKPSGSVDFGRYVSMEVDGEGVHIVAQSALDGVLYYGYVLNTALSGTTITVNWKKVDATSSVGRWTDIKLEDATKSGYAAKPVITYQDAAKLNTISAVKIAYIEDVTNGIWEAMTDPAVCEASDMKLSLAVDVSDGAVKNRYGVGINSTALYVDFLRGE